MPCPRADDQCETHEQRIEIARSRRTDCAAGSLADPTDDESTTDLNAIAGLHVVTQRRSQ